MIIMSAVVGAVAGSLTPIESSVSKAINALSGAVGAILCGGLSICGLGFSARWFTETAFIWLFLIVVPTGAVIGGVMGVFAWDRNVESL